MPIAGLLGGIPPEATIRYYRQIVAQYRARSVDGGYPPLLLGNIDWQRLQFLAETGKYPAMADWLLDELRRLHRAGATVAAMAGDLPHAVFSQLQAQAPLPLLGIAQTAAAAAQRRRLKRVALLGPPAALHPDLYPPAFAAAGIGVVLPPPPAQALLAAKYTAELANGVFLPETRAQILGMLTQLLGRHDLDGVLLAGAELAMLLPDSAYFGLTALDTAGLHAVAIAEAMLDG